MSTRVFVVPGTSFDGGVVDPIQRPVPADAPKRELTDEHMTLLCRLEPDTPELKHHRDVLIGKRLALNAECQKLIEAERVKAGVALREAWERQKTLCREQQGRIEALSAELA